MKMRKFERGGFATSEDSDYNRDSLGDFIVKKDVDRVPVNEVAADEKVVTDDRIARTSPAAAFKSKIVTKEELAKSGMSLRDYMNKQQGLTRRQDKTDTPTVSDKEQQYQRAQEAAQTPEGKAKRAAMEKSQAIEASYPEQALMGGAGFGIKSIAKAAKDLANRGGVKEVAKRVEPTFRETEKQLALPKPTPRLGYDKAGAKAAERGVRAAEQRSEMLKENLKRYGMTEKTSPDAISAVRENLGMGRGFKVMKKGGSAKGYASGGSVSSASKRADGCAIRGKTRA